MLAMMNSTLGLKDVVGLREMIHCSERTRSPFRKGMIAGRVVNGFEVCALHVGCRNEIPRTREVEKDVVDW